MSTLTVPAPAKINLFLAITGRRPDGFHDLVSVVAPLLWGDSVEVEQGGESFTLECDRDEVPTDASNTVLRAAAEFARVTGYSGGAHFRIRKRIPSGAGLGGASSDAVSALRALNSLAGEPLDEAGLARVAAVVGSDCPLFLTSVPVVMRGRGEKISILPKEAYGRFRGMRALLFKPGFAIATPWAYGRMAAEAPRSYMPAEAAEAMLARWIERPGAAIDGLLYNAMERPAFLKFAAIPALLAQLQSRYGISPRMSGSGSACFALLAEDAEIAPVEATIREAWGPSAFVVETRIA